MCTQPTGFQSSCELECSNGNKNVTAGEGCDDGNLDNGDGCDSTCQIEYGYRCIETAGLSTCEVHCGDGIHFTGEDCDDANSN